MKTKKIYAGVLIGAIASFSPVSTLVASAQQDNNHVIIGGVENKNDVSGVDINISKPITLTVQKKGKNPFDENQNDAPQVSGVEFVISKVQGVNVLDDNVRKKVSQEYSYQYLIDHNMTIDKVNTAITNDKGRAVFENLKPGLYVLEQPGVKDAHPQVIMLPLVDAYGTSFTYDDIIVTKNTRDTPPVTTVTNPPKTVVTTTPVTKTRVTETPSTPPVKTSTTVTTYPTTITTPTTYVTTPTGQPPITKTTDVPVEVVTSSTITSEIPVTQTQNIPGKNTTETQVVPGGNQPSGGTPLFPGGPVVDTGGMAIAAAGGSLAIIIAAIVLSGGAGATGGTIFARKKKKAE